jgi:hypothetical protein
MDFVAEHFDEGEVEACGVVFVETPPYTALSVQRCGRGGPWARKDFNKICTPAIPNLEESLQWPN